MLQKDNPPEAPSRVWRHKSVHALLEKHSPDPDPVRIIRRLARETVAQAKEAQWHGPPFSPEDLASFLGITVEPAPAEIRSDARIFPDATGQLRLEFNPRSARQRIRFSICHEIAHTFFPDCYEIIRHRDPSAPFDPVHAELERLCNVGASELLMPLEEFSRMMRMREVTGSVIFQLQDAFDVSLEACLKRVVDLSPDPCAVVFFAPRFSKSELKVGLGNVDEFDLGIEKQLPKLRVRYSHCSPTWVGFIPENKSVPSSDSAVYRCIGDSTFVRGREMWDFLHMELTVLAIELTSASSLAGNSVAAFVRPAREPN